MLTYNTQPGAACAALCPCCTPPLPLCALGAASPTVPPSPAAQPAPVTALGRGEGAGSLSRSLGDLSLPQESSAAGRSMTFSGSLDRHTPRTGPQRPYGRRCKSTAHIVLQNNDAMTHPRPLHDKHGASPAHLHVPAGEARGRARHRTAPASGREIGRAHV